MKIFLKEKPKEPVFSQAVFHRHKFNNRPIPDDKNRIMILTSFGEFSCESLAVHYCIPEILRNNPGRYVIMVGWWGREYYYRHLCDEFWELGEEFQGLREYSDAFKNKSKTIGMIENDLSQFGNVIRGIYFGNLVMGNTCAACGYFWGSSEYAQCCPTCKCFKIQRSMLADVKTAKKKYKPLPAPAPSKIKEAEKILPEKAVGIFARGRKKWNRNLSGEFYSQLVRFLKNNGYQPVWLGEKVSVLPCPADVLDCSSIRDLELVHALVSKMEFTIQFWTASTRIASAVNTPYVIFESPDQVIGFYDGFMKINIAGQEGMRLALTSDFSRKKLILCDYCNFVSNEKKALVLTKQVLQEVFAGNWRDAVAMVAEPKKVASEFYRKSNFWCGNVTSQ